MTHESSCKGQGKTPDKTKKTVWPQRAICSRIEIERMRQVDHMRQFHVSAMHAGHKNANAAKIVLKIRTHGQIHVKPKARRLTNNCLFGPEGCKKPDH